MDTLTKQKRSELMSRVRGKETKLEEIVFAELRRRKIRFRRYGKILGKPDIISRQRKVAIFIDSCFWHGCRWHCRLPSSRKKYWLPKIERNRERDREVTKRLRKEGWRVLRIWEHRIKKNFETKIEEIADLL